MGEGGSREGQCGNARERGYGPELKGAATATWMCARVGEQEATARGDSARHDRQQCLTAVFGVLQHDAVCCSVLPRIANSRQFEDGHI